LTCAASEVQAARDAFNDLALAVRSLSSRTRADLRQEFVLARRDKFLTGLGSPGRARDLADANKLLSEALGADEDWESLRREVCAELLAGVRRLLQQFRERIIAELDERAFKALELGEWVDRGPRPQHVHRFLRVRLTPEQWPTVENPWEDAGGSRQPDEHYYVAERVVSAGDVHPGSLWPRQVLGLCNELRFTKEQTDEVGRLLQDVRPENLVDAVRALDRLIRRALNPSTVLPSWLQVDLTNKVVTVDGVPHTVDFEVAVLVQYVAAAEGEAVSLTKLAASDRRLETLPRADKVLNKTQHRFIKKFISGEGGKGYRLTRR
jgi:hypothetical protein